MKEQLYCEACMRIVDTAECEECGNENLRPLNSDDLVYLTSRNTIFAGMLEDVLRQQDIRYITRSLMGAGFTMLVGNAFEKISFYVPIYSLKEAEDIVDELFGSHDDKLYQNTEQSDDTENEFNPNDDT